MMEKKKRKKLTNTILKRLPKNTKMKEKEL